MALSLKQLKGIKDKYQFIVFGYIRESQKALSLEIIPPLISYLCLGFYYQEMEEFVKTDNKLITISDSKDTITQTTTASDTAYCKQWIDTSIKQIAKWKLKINSIASSNNSIMIRFVSNDERLTEPNYGFNNKGWTYTNGPYKDRRGMQFAGDDIMEIMLNTSDGSITAIHNDAEPRAIYNGIQVGDKIRYKLAIFLYRKDNSVSLLDFELNLM